MSRLPPSDSFEYLCYGSTANINIFTLTVRGWTLDVYRRQNLMSKADPRTVKVNPSPIKLSYRYLNFHPLEVVSRYCDSQLHVNENYLYLSNLGSSICES